MDKGGSGVAIGSQGGYEGGQGGTGSVKEG